MFNSRDNTCISIRSVSSCNVPTKTKVLYKSYCNSIALLDHCNINQSKQCGKHAQHLPFYPFILYHSHAHTNRNSIAINHITSQYANFVFPIICFDIFIKFCWYPPTMLRYHEAILLYVAKMRIFFAILVSEWSLILKE